MYWNIDGKTLTACNDSLTESSMTFGACKSMGSLQSPALAPAAPLI